MKIRKAGRTTGFRLPPFGAREVRAMTKHVGSKLRGSLPEPAISFRFSDRDVEAVISHVEAIHQKKLNRLNDVLNDWATHEMRKAFSVYPSKSFAQKRLKVIRLIAKHAESLRLALEDFEQLDCTDWLVGELVSNNPSEYGTEEALHTARLTAQCALLPEIEAAAKRLEKHFAPALDQRRNVSAVMLLFDMEAIFEWLTEERAERGSADRPQPFDDFIGVLWSAIFNNVHGMQGALKNWAKYRNESDYKSSVLFNISLRHPEWRLFGTTSQEAST
jgi:hypothetical protein